MTSEPLRHFLHGSRDLFPAVMQQMFSQHYICILLHSSLAGTIAPHRAMQIPLHSGILLRAQVICSFLCCSARARSWRFSRL